MAASEVRPSTVWVTVKDWLPQPTLLGLMPKSNVPFFVALALITSLLLFLMVIRASGVTPSPLMWAHCLTFSGK